jgi:predicted transcriptional regulator
MKTVNYTSSLPPDILDKLDSYAQKFNIPKNRIIEKALLAYFENLKRAEYTYSFQKAAVDGDMLLLAEEGIEEYLKILDNE